MASAPILTTGQLFLHSWLHFFGRHLRRARAASSGVASLAEDSGAKGTGTEQYVVKHLYVSKHR